MLCSSEALVVRLTCILDQMMNEQSSRAHDFDAVLVRSPGSTSERDVYYRSNEECAEL